MDDGSEQDLRKLAASMSFEDIMKYRKQSFLLDDDNFSDSSTEYEFMDGGIPFYRPTEQYFHEPDFDPVYGYFPEVETYDRDLILYDIFEYLFPINKLFIDKSVELFWMLLDTKRIYLTDLYYDLAYEGKSSREVHHVRRSDDIQWWLLISLSKFNVSRSIVGCCDGKLDTLMDLATGCCDETDEDIDSERFASYVMQFGYFWFSNRAEYAPFRFLENFKRRKMSVRRSHPTPLTRDVRFMAPCMLRLFPDMRASDRRTTFEQRERKRQMKKAFLYELLKRKIEAIGNVVPVVLSPLILVWIIGRIISIVISRIIPSYFFSRMSASYLEEFPPSDPFVPPWHHLAQSGY